MSEKLKPLPNWKVPCQVCGIKPTIDDTKLCGVCTFGEADMVDWYVNEFDNEINQEK